MGLYTIPLSLNNTLIAMEGFRSKIIRATSKRDLPNDAELQITAFHLQSKR